MKKLGPKDIKKVDAGKAHAEKIEPHFCAVSAELFKAVETAV